MEGQSPPLGADDAELGCAAHLSARLQTDFRRRRLDEPLRDHAAGRLGRASQRGGGGGVDAAHHADLSACGVAKPGAGGALGLHALDPHDEAIDERADVSADAGGVGQCDAGVGEVDLLRRKYAYKFRKAWGG